MTMDETLALVGNPNSGKTTLFNALTGAKQHIGNWPGVTVERKSSRLKANPAVIIEDLPGTYSLSPYSSEEIVTRDFLLEKQPDLVINVVDATNLERNLYLTLQVMETGRPLMVALNMMDVLEKSHRRTINLKKLSYALQVPVIGTTATKPAALKELVQAIQAPLPKPYAFPEYDPRLESALSMLEEVIGKRVPADRLRWYAIKLFEKDPQIVQQLAFTTAEQQQVTEILHTAEHLFDDASDSIIVNARYDFIARVMAMCVVDKEDFVMSVSDRIDRIVTDRYLALPIFVLVMWVVYYLSIQTVGTIGSDYLNDTVFGGWLPAVVGGALKGWAVAPWLSGLIVNGLIGGIGSVLGFLPQIMMLFLCLGILEDCGYMARIAFVMDRLFHRFNLSGKSFIPILIATGCGVPGIMATRTIESEKDRRMSIMLTTFMPCSAKLTVIALVSGTFFPNNSWVAPSAYFMGIIAVVCSGIFLKKTALFAGPPAPFVMELPAYHLPRVTNLYRSVMSRARAFVHKAGTIIFLSCVLLWFLSHFDFTLRMVQQNKSMLRGIGGIIAPIFAPLGFGDWHTTVATLAGLIAKENCVSTLHISFGGTGGFGQTLRATYPAMAGYAFLMFNLLCAPCFAAIGTMYKEFGDARWTWRAVGYQTGVAYLLTMLIYQGSLIVGGQANVLSIGLVAVAVTLIIYGLWLKRPHPVVASGYSTDI
ncbi:MULTISPECIES: ferrous iron transport protein B [Lacticaseibacillus]|uniref:Ferrous iron transport protein B n=1 Tax=Lacticaseibacillus zeae subsp. silagei TaxID=3068307 RepID=A0ABD7Z6K7_LACZE|nr:MULTISPECIES: ferrous iron transport protein B [Lacticaseibacillus]OFS00713.1 ferrous iron transport protein B [Lactobacillus sp. HMSC068F07]MDE3282765.1 ferrous iron transport protein B [Lacticaseibacillus casei]MDE3315564.1 ferrous iron transport protein B [Lacticaseibacillus zeae]WLV82624.1 ferrous iron transport protein B [Lacticaseibacillus sp. NCIMB 15475]WLV87546.1 ferrous iron transport protein B [Lacticaseibacillus sp. NCIMB 15474]